MNSKTYADKVNAIVKRQCSCFGIDADELRGTRDNFLIQARRAVCIELKETLQMSYKDIGKVINRSRTQVARLLKGYI